MRTSPEPWDYLIITASNEDQAQAYRAQLDIRRELGMFAGVGDVLVIPDLNGRRIGSGGSTILCLMEVLARELPAAKRPANNPDDWRECLGRLRILIVHAGGDSRRLPAYGPCGKLFIPAPGESDSAIAPTLFDRQLPSYLALPPAQSGLGQVVITAGDALLSFDPAEVRFAPVGVTGLGAYATPEAASKHGVFCASEGRVNLFLQKPSVQVQQETGAVNRYGQSILDVGVMSFDAATATLLLQFAGANLKARPAWSGEVAQAIESQELDFYREICCAMGAQVTSEHHAQSALGSGSRWSAALLGRLFQVLSQTPFHVQTLPRCGFLHFGTTGQIISSGQELLRLDEGVSQVASPLAINTEFTPRGGLTGHDSWVEGCRIDATVKLGGRNVLVGLDVGEELDLPRGACVDLMAGRNRQGTPVWFVKCYGVGDTFKDTVAKGATFCGQPVEQWLSAVGAAPEDCWSADLTAATRTVWDAKLFPAVAQAQDFTAWLWMFAPDAASAGQKQAWKSADRYSLAEIALLADAALFHARRRRLRAEEIRGALRRMFRRDSQFSARELAYTLAQAPDPARMAAEILGEAQWHLGDDGGLGMASFVFSRIMHTIASAVGHLAGAGPRTLGQLLGGLDAALSVSTRVWLEKLGVPTAESLDALQWAKAIRQAAFRQLGRAIMHSGQEPPPHPVSALRSDEIVWGRAPARLDLGGGWTDTPPYTLEHGGAVLNAAVNLNGQPPIHAYARVIEEPLIRITSIDLGTRVEIRDLESLLDYNSAVSEFALAKAALALSGFAPDSAVWPEGLTLGEMLGRFGGGIELTTLAAIPKGSGLGTSSIVGATVLAVVQRMMGRTLTAQQLFHGVLRLEQALTTGGGWQDQIGGAVGGAKVITTEPALVPDATIHYVPHDILNPTSNAGCTLLYYTGITRLAKNILQQVVGRYLDRDRVAMATLRQLHALPPRVAEALARKDLPAFGRLIDTAWRLNKQLDPDSSNPAIEDLLARVAPHVYGAKLLGAGGGGFLLLVCRSPQDAAKVRGLLECDPPNRRARFFDFDVSTEGLVVTVC